MNPKSSLSLQGLPPSLSLDPHALLRELRLTLAHLPAGSELPDLETMTHKDVDVMMLIGGELLDALQWWLSADEKVPATESGLARIQSFLGDHVAQRMEAGQAPFHLLQRVMP